MRICLSVLLLISLSINSYASFTCSVVFSPAKVLRLQKQKKLAEYKVRFQEYKLQAEKNPALIEQASEVLQITPKEFLRRLVQIGVSPLEIKQQVEIEAGPNKSPIYKLVFNPRQLAKTIKSAVKERQIVDPNFLRNFMEMAGIHTGAQAITHMLKFDFGAMGILTAQLAALLITEVALTFTSAKGISYLIANRSSLREAKEEYQKLDPQQKIVFNSFSARLKSFAKNFNFNEMMKNTGKKIPNLAKIAFVTSLIPFSILAMGKESEIADIASLALLNASFHALFISVWSNFRYELFYGQIFPLIKNTKLTGNNSFLERNLIRSLMAVNMIVASYSYSAGSDAAYGLFGKDFQ